VPFLFGFITAENRIPPNKSLENNACQPTDTLHIAAMRKKIFWAIVGAVALFNLGCPTNGRADEKITPLQSAISSTTVSGGDIMFLFGSSVGNVDVAPSEFSISPVPEPSATGFFALGILWLVLLAKFKSRSSRTSRPAGNFGSDLCSPPAAR
jgi:hypothetical protein